MNKAFKFRIFPNEDQKKKIENTFDCVRFIFNKMLEDKLAYYSETGKMLKNTPAQYKTAYPAAFRNSNPKNIPGNSTLPTV